MNTAIEQNPTNASAGEIPALAVLTPPNETDSKTLPLKERCGHIPYILNGELYEIQTQEGENVTVKCCNCPPDRVYRGSIRSTGNFHMHIKRRHPDLLGKLHEMKVNALLERRDRLIRNRKTVTRAPNSNPNHTPNTTATASSTGSVGVVKREPSAAPGDPAAAAALCLSPTHMLKIKTAFQRHQQQQQQQTLASWSLSPIVVSDAVSIASKGLDLEPLNFSRTSATSALMESSQEVNETHHCLKVLRFHDLQPQVENHQFGVTPHHYSEVEANGSEGVIPLTPCSSSGSTCSTWLSCVPSVTNPAPIVAGESIEGCPTMVCKEQQAMDLSIQNRSFSSSGVDTATYTSAESSTYLSSRNQPGPFSIPRCDEGALSKLESVLQDIKRELQRRNQIESNRFYLDLAKFKHMNPNFNYH